MKKMCGVIVAVFAGIFMLQAAPVVKVCKGNGSVNVQFSVEYGKPYWYVSKGNTTGNRIFRFEEGPRRVQPNGGGAWVYELKNDNPRRLVNRKGKVILEYRDGNIYKPGTYNAVGIYKDNAFYKGSKCIANIRNGKLPLGVALTIAAQFYFSEELGFTPESLKASKPKVATVNISVLSLPFNKKAVTTFYAGDPKDGKVLYTFRNGFIYEGKMDADDRSKAKYAVGIGKFAQVGKRKNVPYIIYFYDLQNKIAKPVYTFQSIVRFALFRGDSVEAAPVYHLHKNGVCAGSQNQDIIGVINQDGSKLFRGTKAEGTPVLSVVGNRRNHWVEMFIWAKVLEKDIDDYLKANPQANQPFPAKKK